MKKTDKISYRQKPLEELSKELLQLKNSLVEAKAKLAMGNLKDTSVIKKTKYQISLLNTLLKEKQNAN